MSDNILGQRFYNNEREPAWHGLGINDPDMHTAVEALERLGIYHVEKRPLYITLNDEQKESGFYSVVREPLPDDPHERILGAPVSGDFWLPLPKDGAELWDENVRDLEGSTAAVETLGILDRGGRMFISTKLPRIDVRGDEVDIFLLYDQPLHSGNALGVYTTGIRVVCANTLAAGIDGAVQKKTIAHKVGARDQIGEWLKTVYQNALKTRELMDEAYNILANKPVNEVEIKWIIDNTYPIPREPEFTDDNAYTPIARRLERWERECDLTLRLRKLGMELVESGTSMDTAAVKGTAFGAWNAVTELETYRKGRTSKIVSGLFNGDRSRRIQNAFTLAMATGTVSEYTEATAQELELIPVKSC